MKRALINWNVNDINERPVQKLQQKEKKTRFYYRWDIIQICGFLNGTKNYKTNNIDFVKFNNCK